MTSPVSPPSPIKPSMPTSLVAATALAILLAILGAMGALGSVGQGVPAAAVVFLWLPFTAGATYCAFGFRRGWRPAQATAVGLGAVMIFYGLYLQGAASRLVVVLSGLDTLGYLIILVGGVFGGLVIIPKSSRWWFDHYH